jgi:DNA polymerase
MRMLIIDFETRSECDLITHGAYQYAEHPSTEVLCMSYAWDDGKHVYNWQPGGHLPQAFYDEVNNGGLVAAHNAEFDWLIWNEVLTQCVPSLPRLPIEQMYCTSAMCRVNGMPASLDKATRCAGVEHKKNATGTALIKKMCIPPYEFNDTLMGEMARYCDEDVLATRALMHKLRPMTQTEHKDWCNNLRVNARGIYVDKHLAQLATTYATEETEQIGKLLDSASYGVVSKHTQHQRVKAFCTPLLTEDQTELTVKWVEGERKISMDGAIRQELLQLDDLDDAVRTVVSLVDSASKSSVSKFQKMLDLSTEEGLLRGAFVYYGASQTGRYSAKGLQLHNFIRDALSYDEVEDLVSDMEEDYEIEDPMKTLSRALRGAIVPSSDDTVFVVGDWSAIEACALPWLAKDHRAQPKLDALKAKEDIYKTAFTGWKGDERQVHKVIELSLGYGGAVGAFNAMARNYGVSLPDHDIARIVSVWRAKNQWAVDFWRKVACAAKGAVHNPGEWYWAGRLRYICTTSGVGDKTLLCYLPDDTVLTYPDVLFEPDDRGGSKLTAIKANFNPKKGAPNWPRVDLWYGLLVENATQGTCAALLREKLDVIENARPYSAVAHVHDEIIVEAKENDGTLEDLQKVMEACPEWADGLPLNADPKIMWRYGK